jgi:membrane-associated phospholipid phosphatase
VHHDELPANLVAYLCNPIPYAILSALVLIAALVTGGRGRALVVAAMLVVPNGVTQVLKDLTAEDRITGPATWAVHVDPASWPSGHATASLALALGAAVASPLAYRWLVAGVGLVFAAAVGLAVILLGWHFPSDVAGGYCVAAAGASLGAAALSRQATTAAPAVRWHPARG